MQNQYLNFGLFLLLNAPEECERNSKVAKVQV